MAWVVMRHFLDTQDNRHSYSTGDHYPRAGYVPTDERVAELASDRNRRGAPLIVKAEDRKDAGEAKEFVSDVFPPEEAKVAEPQKKRGRKPKTGE